MTYQRTILSANPSVEELTRVRLDYEEILLANLKFIIERYKRRRDYRWIDTKFDILAGRDYPDDDAMRGYKTVYGWIQGRGLEALATILKEHSEFHNREKFSALAAECIAILRDVLHNLYDVWQCNNGHITFMMDVAGKSIVPIRGSGYTITDVFCSKGMLAAASVLGEKEILKDAIDYCLSCYRSVIDGTIVNDQIVFDAKNPAVAQEGKVSHAPFMLEIGAMALLAEHAELNNIVRMGFTVIEHIIEHHININNKWDKLEPFDFVEFIDSRGELFVTDGRILSDPGHAIEFVGLSLKFIDVIKCRRMADYKENKKLAGIADVLYPVLIRNFRRGFNAKTGGIYKTVDLLMGEPVNSDMPWWSLPETMRAAIKGAKLFTETERKQNCLAIFGKSHNAFVSHYIREDKYLLAVQTRDENGNMVSRIPATPDIDPCYHTGLSLLDCIVDMDEIKLQ